jgi:DNA replication licensing factor MCM5
LSHYWYRDAQASSSPEAIAENVSRIASTGVGELDVPSMKKYIQFCKAKCSPRLSEEAGDILASSYVKIRDDVRKGMMSSSRTDGNGQVIDDQPAVPITVRQLEALIRVSESLSKMRLEEEVQSEDIAEALRLFKVSTMAANSVDNKGAPQGGVGANGSGSILRAAAPSREETMRTEMFLKSRLAIGSIVNKQRIVEEAAGQGYDASIVARAIGVMIMRGELQERNQGRLFKRIM